MFKIVEVENIYFILDTTNNQVFLSYSEYGRLVKKAESTIRRRFNNVEGIIKANIEGLIRSLIPAQLCLQMLIDDDPSKISIFMNNVLNITGIRLDVPDFTNIKIKENKQKTEYSPIGFIYIFQSVSDILKVGFTKNIKTRLNQLQRWSGELTIIDVVQGSIYQEKELHKTLHATGEYFGDEWYPVSRKDEILILLETIAECCNT